VSRDVFALNQTRSQKIFWEEAIVTVKHTQLTIEMGRVTILGVGHKTMLQAEREELFCLSPI